MASVDFDRLVKESVLIHRFGVFELDASVPELRRGGRRLPLQEQPLQILETLLERPGEVVSREELRQRLWPPDVHVDFDNGINAAVGRLREALDDAASNPRFVATVPRRGYRFIAPVERLATAADTEPPPGATVPAPWRRAFGAGAAKLAALTVVALAVGAVTGGVLEQWRHDPQPTLPRPLLRLAVLPFESLASDPGREFLGDALTEELITVLGRLQPERLRVIARTSVMAYKGQDAGIDEIGRRLDVDFVLEGAVRQEGDAVRVNAALVEVAGQTRIWSATFDRRLVSLMALEREIASEVTGALALELLEPEPSTAADSPAHELYLEGRYFLGRLTGASFDKAIRAFEAALEQDPRLAAAHAGLAGAWVFKGLFDFAPRREVYPRALASAERALELDPSSAEGHLVLALIHFLYEWDFAEAEAAFERALALNPSRAEAHLFAADFQASLGRSDDAVAAAERALELDPLSLAVNVDVGWRLFVAGREEEAIERCHRALELDDDFLEAWDVLKWIHIRRGDEKQAIAAFFRVVELEELHADGLPEQRQLAARDGLAGLLRDSLKDPEKRIREGGQSPYNLVLDYAALGEVDTALDWLERSFAERETDLVHLAVDPRLDVLRGDARFRSLLARVGLPQEG